MNIDERAKEMSDETGWSKKNCREIITEAIAVASEGEGCDIYGRKAVEIYSTADKARFVKTTEGFVMNLNWDDVNYFNPDEFDSPDKMNMALIYKLEIARIIADIPFIITSSYREGDDGAHGKGLAVDIGCSNDRPRFNIVKALLLAGFDRVGIYNKHIHADIDSSGDPRVMWTGISQ